MRFSSMMASLALLLCVETALGNDRSVITAIDLATLHDIGGHHSGAISVSPDGRWVVFQLQTPEISQGDYELTWMAISTDGGRAFRVADGGDVLLNPTLRGVTNGSRPQVRAQWSPDSSSFAYLVRRHGQTQIWRSRPHREEGRVQLTHNAGDTIDFVWSPDGSKLYFRTGLDRAQLAMRKREEGKRGFLYDNRFYSHISTQPVRRACELVLPSYRGFSLARACEPAVWSYDLRTGKERLATREEAKAYSQLREFGFIAPETIEGRAFKRLRRWGDGNQYHYAWLENTDPEIYRGPYAPLTIFALVDDDIRRCVEEVCRAYTHTGHQDLWWSQNGQEVIFLRRDGPSHGTMGLYAWAPSTGGMRIILQTDDDWLSDCAPAGNRLICLYETWTQPRKIVSVSLADGSITTLYDPNPEFASHRYPKIEKLEWDDAFGNSTYGHLVYPIDYKPGRTYPLVIVTYQSRGFLRGGVGDEYPILPLAAEGFFVLSHEMPFDTELVAKRPDINAALSEDLYLRKSVLSSQDHIIKQLAKAGLIDKARIAITGLSEGAAQTTYALIHADTAFAVAIVTSLWVSPNTYYLMTEDRRDSARFRRHGSPDNPDSDWHVLSIGLNADRVSAPLLINVSDDEFLGSLANVARLQDANKPVEMYVYPGEHHVKWQPDHRLAVYRRNIQWLKFWLLGEIEPDPVAPGQYERWIAMCTQHVKNRAKTSAPLTFCVSDGDGDGAVAASPRH